MVIKKIRKVGCSVGCIFGKEAEILSGLKLGDNVIITAEKDTIIIKKVEAK